MAKANKVMWYLGFAGMLMTAFSWGFCKDTVCNSED